MRSGNQNMELMLNLIHKSIILDFFYIFFTTMTLPTPRFIPVWLEGSMSTLNCPNWLEILVVFVTYCIGCRDSTTDTPNGFPQGCTMYFRLMSKLFSERIQLMLVQSLLIRHLRSSNGFLPLFIAIKALQVSSDCFKFPIHIY